MFDFSKHRCELVSCKIKISCDSFCAPLHFVSAARPLICPLHIKVHPVLQTNRPETLVWILDESKRGSLSALLLSGSHFLAWTFRCTCVERLFSTCMETYIWDYFRGNPSLEECRSRLHAIFLAFFISLDTRGTVVCFHNRVGLEDGQISCPSVSNNIYECWQITYFQRGFWKENRNSAKWQHHVVLFWLFFLYSLMYFFILQQFPKKCDCESQIQTLS